MQKKLLSLLVCAGLASMAHATLTDQMIDNDAKSTGDVLSWGIGTQGQRYSPLKQINPSSISKLVPVWSFSFGGEKQRGQESQPVIHNGKMFVTASYSRIFALDAKSGKKLWKYEHRLPDGIMPCCDVINRGAALYGNLVIFGTLDAQLVALNQETGEVEWKEKIDDYAAGYTPDFAGVDSFGGRIVHPLHWPADVDYAGKTVVVIGSGATAVTLVPEMAKTASHVTMLQRSPTYVVSRPAEDGVANWLRAKLPAMTAYGITRWKNVLMQMLFFNIARKKPEKTKAQLIDLVRGHRMIR